MGLIIDFKFKLLICSGNNNWNVLEKVEFFDVIGLVVFFVIYNFIFKDFFKFVGIFLFILLYKNLFDYFY